MRDRPRGGLIPDFLADQNGAREYLDALGPRAARYGGFNLLLADEQSLWYGSNRTEPFARSLEPGVYGLSNHSLDTPWPKLIRVRASFERWLAASPDAVDEASALLEMLADRRTADAVTEPAQAGSPASWEQALSAPFVEHPQFGTRCSTVVLLEPSGALRMSERRFDRLGRQAGQSEYRLAAQQWC